MPDWLRLALFPPAEAGKVDTGLRFTDVLFGFVIRELFLRLQNWSTLPGYVRWQLCVGAALVLGSWIGFRRSLNRTAYEVKFFNLPLFRFLADQLMVILYFRIAVLTPMDGTAPPPAEDLTRSTAQLLALVFGLYALWDVLGARMATKQVRDRSSRRTPKYPALVDGTMTSTRQPVDTWGLSITASFFILFVILWRVTETVDRAQAGIAVSALAVFLLLAYRMAKEVRTSWRSR